LRLGEDGTDRLHGLDQSTRNLMGAVVEPLGTGSGLVEFGREARPLVHQPLRIDFDPLLLSQPRIEIAYALVEPAKRAIEPRRCRRHSIFQFALIHCTRPRDSAVSACPSAAAFATAAGPVIDRQTEPVMP